MKTNYVPTYTCEYCGQEYMLSNDCAECERKCKDSSAPCTHVKRSYYADIVHNYGGYDLFVMSLCKNCGHQGAVELDRYDEALLEIIHLISRNKKSAKEFLENIKRNMDNGL